MTMYNLYRLEDQAGDIFGSKVLMGTYLSVSAAQTAAAAGGYIHYSVEQASGNFAEDSIVFIC